MGNNTITLRSWAGPMKEYHFMPCKQANGLNLPFVKPVEIMPDGSSKMILSESERNKPESQYYIPEDLDIVVTNGTTFDLDNPFERNKWLAIKDSDLIAPSRNATDKDGNNVFDGNKMRYGIAELWIDVPGQESERIVSKKKKVNQAWTFIENDSLDGRLTKCKLLGKNMKNAPSPDVEAFLYEIAEKTPDKIINLYTNSDTALKLMFIDARDKNVIIKNNGVYEYGETVLGATEDAVLFFFKLPNNKRIVDLIKYQVYPEFALKNNLAKKEETAESAPVDGDQNVTNEDTTAEAKTGKKKTTK